MSADLNGDGKADILLQNDSGQIWQWLMSGNQIMASNPIGNPGQGWSVMATGDASLRGTPNGDDPFIFMQNAVGEVWGWAGDPFLPGASLANELHSGAVADPGQGWHVVGAADISGNGIPSVLLQSDSGQVWEWSSDVSTILNDNGSYVPSSSNPIGNPGPWHVAATGDLNGDGRADIVLQNDNGEVWDWLMRSGNIVTGSNDLGNPGPGWHVVGTGNFLAPVAQSDILLQNDSGEVMQWQPSADGSQVALSLTFGNPGPSWHVAGTGSLDGGVFSDILFQNGSGQVWEWQMQGGNSPAASVSIGNPGPSWHVV